jgi:hypothetical protein
MFLITDGIAVGDCSQGGGSTRVFCYSTGSGYITMSGVNFPGQSNTYATNAVQVFPVSSSFADLVIGTTSLDPCCSMQPGSTWINLNGLNGNPHMDWFDGNFYWANITNGDNVCNLANQDGSSNPSCSGTGAVVLANGATLTNPNIGDATGTSLTLAQTTGDQFDLQPGLGNLVSGSLTSGTFVTGENIVQGTSGAASTFTGIEGTGNLLLGGITGSPDASHTWVGQTSGAVFTPTATPGTPYIQAIAQSGHIKSGYGSDGTYKLSYGDTYLTASRTVVSGTAVMTTATILAGACGSTVTVSAANVTTADVISFSYAAAVSTQPGLLNVNAWVTAGNVNFTYCNPTASASGTIPAATLNWSVKR